MLVVHCKKARYDVYIGRPSPWGNPFSHKQGTLAQFQVASREEGCTEVRNVVPYAARHGRAS
jgi:hypothetical protein